MKAAAPLPMVVKNETFVIVVQLDNK